MIYYRIEKEMLPVGFTITRNGPSPLVDSYPDVESILEKNRPANRLCRSESVYMRIDRDFRRMGLTFECGFVHQLKPVKPVELRDVYWLGVLQRRQKADARLPDQHGQLSDDEVAERYWNVEQPESSSIEYATRAAQVVHVENEKSLVRPNTLNNLLSQLRNNANDT